METVRYDIGISSEAIDTEAGLRTHITISLLTRGRARPDDVIPDPTDRGGWWGDTYDESGRTVGSRLWTLVGRKINAATIADAEQMIREALQWLIDLRYIGAIEVQVAQIRHGVIGATIAIRPPVGTTFKPLGLWEFSL